MAQDISFSGISMSCDERDGTLAVCGQGVTGQEPPRRLWACMGPESLFSASEGAVLRRHGLDGPLQQGRSGSKPAPAEMLLAGTGEMRISLFGTGPPKSSDSTPGGAKVQEEPHSLRGRSDLGMIWRPCKGTCKVSRLHVWLANCLQQN